VQVFGLASRIGSRLANRTVGGEEVRLEFIDCICAAFRLGLNEERLRFSREGADEVLDSALREDARVEGGVVELVDPGPEFLVINGIFA